MSKRQGGRKAKANKNKQAKGGNPSSLSNGQQFPRDEHHNMNLPCCRLLRDVTAELVAIGTPQQQTSTQRPASLLGHMIRNHLLEQRRREATAAATAETSKSSSVPSPSKKKKKKKKKKATNSSNASNPSSTAATAKEDATKAVGQEADETDSTAVVASTVSQDSHPSVSVPAASSTATATTSASTVPSAITSSTTSATTATTTITNQDIATATPPTTMSSTTPVDLYLDRLLSAQQQQRQQLQQQEGLIDSSSSSKETSIRDIEAFLKYLNEKHRPSSNNSTWISITRQEVELACRQVVCPHCQQQVHRSLQQMVNSKQPVVLPAISFTGNNAVPPPPPHNHNGLAVPVHNAKPNAPPPTLDFDYVAMEEGSSPMGTLLEAKADLEGIPYFHPHTTNAAAEATNNSADAPGSNSNTTNKKQSKKGEESSSVPANGQFEWHFVSSSSSVATPPSFSEGSPSKQQPAASPYITLGDLEHVVKDVMLPLSIPPDELLGTSTVLSDTDIRDLQQQVSDWENQFSVELEHVFGELRKYQHKYEELCEIDRANTSELGIEYANKFHDIDEALPKLLDDIVYDLAWDRLLWLSGSQKMSVSRPTPAWESMVAYLTDECTKTIMGMMEAVDTYESQLQNEIANAQGKIPEMFVNSGHRVIYRNMIETKLRLVGSLLETVKRASEALEEIWPQTTGGRGGVGMNVQPHQQLLGVSGLLLYFRRIWFVEQEFYRRVAEIQQRKEATTAGTKKGSSSSPGNRAKGKAAFQQAQHSSTVAPISHNGVNPKWTQALDVYGGDLLRGLIAFTGTVKQGRLADMKEEHMIRVEKHLGLLTKVGEECIRPLVDKDENCTRYTLKDDNLMNQCRNLWTKIQGQRELQQQQQLLAADGEGPSVLEQKHTVAEMTLDLLRLLRNLRKNVADSYGPKNAPLMPLRIVAWMSDPEGISNGVNYQNVDLLKTTYNSLVSMAAVADKVHYQCTGGSGELRLKSLLLALFYRKLSEHCSEWHAELAEQELLTTMGSGVEGTNGLSGVAGSDPNSAGKNATANKNGVSANAANSATPGKSRKRKPKPKKPLADIAAEDKTSRPQSPVPENQTKEATIRINGREDNGQQGKDGVTAETIPGRKLEEESSALDKLFVMAAAYEAKEISTAHVDTKMGVEDHKGTFQTAERYLAGRITALLKASGKKASGKKAQGNAPVVII